MQRKGFIKLWRKTLYNGILGHPFATALFVYLILSCVRERYNYTTRSKVVILEPGEWIIGRIGLSKELGMSEQNLRTALKLLAKMKILTIESTSEYSLIRLVNYKKYQDMTSDLTSELTSIQPAPNQRLTTKKEVLEVREEYSSVFESVLWKPYPARKGKKQGKKPAYRLWLKLNPTGDLLEKIRIGVLAIQKEEYPRDAVKWLRDEGWNDEIVKKLEYKGPSYV